MKILFNRFIIEYEKIYLYISLISVVLKLLIVSLKDVEMLFMMNSIWILISSTLSILLSTYYIYEFLYTRKKYFYYTLKYSKKMIVFILASVLLLFNFINYMIYSDFNTWFSLQKIISLSTYFMTILVLLYLLRTISFKKLAINIFLVVLMSGLILHSLFFYYIFSDSIGNHFMLGVSSIEGASNLYNNIVPITLFVENNVYNHLSFISLCGNIGISCILTIVFVNLKNLKINW